jgi:hypothetical protein
MPFDCSPFFVPLFDFNRLLYDPQWWFYGELVVDPKVLLPFDHTLVF